jgi:hypothetical protein
MILKDTLAQLHYNGSPELTFWVFWYKRSGRRHPQRAKQTLLKSSQQSLVA